MVKSIRFEIIVPKQYTHVFSFPQYFHIRAKIFRFFVEMWMREIDRRSTFVSFSTERPFSRMSLVLLSISFFKVEVSYLILFAHLKLVACFTWKTCFGTLL